MATPHVWRVAITGVEGSVKYLLLSVDYFYILHTTALSTCTQGDVRLVGGMTLNEG